MTIDSQKLLLACVDKIKEKKGMDIVSLKLKDITLICDYFIILTAGSARQSRAIADFLYEELKAEYRFPRLEGYQEGRWLLMDYGAVVIHIMLAEERQYYNLEKLWADAPAESY